MALAGTPGESLGVLLVNSESKYKASSAPQTAGLKGGRIFFPKRAGQSIVAKNGCLFKSWKKLSLSLSAWIQYSNHFMMKYILNQINNSIYIVTIYETQIKLHRVYNSTIVLGITQTKTIYT